MNARFRWFSLLSIASILLLVPGVAIAQSDDVGPQMAVAGAMLLFALVVGLVFYVYFALALQTIASKTGTENPWLAWIPIANLFLLLLVAKKPLWWFVLMLIPLVNIVILIIVWMAVAEARHKPNWWGVLMIVPVANLIVPGYLAWSD